MVTEIQHEVDRLVGVGQVKVTDAGEGRVGIGDDGGSWALVRAQLALDALSSIRGPLEIGEEGQDCSLVDIVCGLESLTPGMLDSWLRDVGLLVEPTQGGIVVRVDGYTAGMPVAREGEDAKVLQAELAKLEHTEIVRATATTYVDIHGVAFYRAPGPRGRPAGQQKAGLARIMPFDLGCLLALV
jgi:hypothetical protein